MRFVPIKNTEQQAALVLHRTRHLYVRQMTALINALRGHLAEYGIVAPQGRNGVAELVAVINDTKDQRIPALVRTCLTALSIQLGSIKQQIAILDRRLIILHRSNEASKRLDAIPGVGPALATALVASVADPKIFKSGRDFSAWIGLVPKQNSTGGKERLGNITRAGDRYLRSLFCAGALAVIRYEQQHGAKNRPWVAKLLERRPAKVAAIALANKIARMAWAMMATGASYREPAALAK
jgi:transposase